MSWLHALFTFIALVTGSALAFLVMFLYRDNRWVASAGFVFGVVCMAISVPVFFAIGIFG